MAGKPSVTATRGQQTLGTHSTDEEREHLASGFTPSENLQKTRNHLHRWSAKGPRPSSHQPESNEGETQQYGRPLLSTISFLFVNQVS